MFPSKCMDNFEKRQMWKCFWKGWVRCINDDGDIQLTSVGFPYMKLLRVAKQKKHFVCCEPQIQQKCSIPFLRLNESLYLTKSQNGMGSKVRLNILKEERWYGQTSPEQKQAVEWVMPGWGRAAYWAGNIYSAPASPLRPTATLCRSTLHVRRSTEVR